MSGSVLVWATSFFGVSETAVTVLAVLHHRRSPRRWPRRAAG